MDADEIKSAAKVRIGLLNIACKVCNDDIKTKLDGMENIDIKKAIVKSKHDINLDEKSEDYINAFVDAVKADMKDKDDTQGVGNEIIKNRQDGSTEDNSILEAKKKSMQNDSEAWTKPLNEAL